MSEVGIREAVRERNATAARNLVASLGFLLRRRVGM